MTSSAWRMVAAVCVAYMLSHFFRAANAVIGSDLMRELSLAPADLGFLTAVFFVVFAGLQIPIGILLDRYGPRRVMLSLTMMAVAGSALFAYGHDLATLSVARALLGIGTASLLVGPLVLFSRWFAPERFAAVSGFFVAIGTAGGLFATTPLALLAQTAGWRGAFLAMSVITLAVLCALALTVRDSPDGRLPPARGESFADALRGVIAVARDPRTPGIFGMNMTVYATGIAILGLWGAPYLIHVHGLTKVTAGNILLAMGIANVAGYLAAGPAERLMGSRKWPAALSSLLVVAQLAALALVPGMPLAPAVILFIGIGFMSGGFVLVVAHGRAIAPDHLVGRAVTLFNIGTMGGAAAMQWLSGLLIGAIAGPETTTLPEVAYRAMFALLATCLALAVLGYSRVREPRLISGDTQHAP